MKKEILIGMLFLMFAFVIGCSPKTDVDIGSNIECVALDVDHMATLDNAVASEVILFKTINEAEVEISPGDCLNESNTAKAFLFVGNCNHGNINLTNTINKIGDIFDFNIGKVPLYDSDDNNINKNKIAVNTRYLKRSGTARIRNFKV